MAVRIKKGDSLGLLNLTPVIDVVFNLLIFFLVAASLTDDEAKQQQLLDIVLPQASQARPLTSRPRELFVDIDRQGRYHVQGQQLDVTRLLAALRQAATDNPGRQAVIIRADHRCVWQYVVTAMDQCNEAGIRDYKVSTLEQRDG
jgi:biopolymer transport protein ExbD